MAQYCRYCTHAIQVDMDKVYCRKKNYCYTEKQSKHTNSCKHYELNPVDALRENEKGYSPTGIKPVELGGLGKQIRIDELMKESKK